MIDNKLSVAVIGGGAAGLMAACALTDSGVPTTLYEKNPIMGKKLRITGKGRCNVTNDSTSAEIMANVTRNAKFLYSALYKYTPEDVKNFFEAEGVPLKTERGRRVFPESDKAADICAAFEKKIKRGGVEIVRSSVNSLIIEDGVCRGVADSYGEHYHSAVILATGGVSYPGTGSTGDGFRMAKEAGLDVTELRPSLVPIVCKEKTSEYMGLSLKNVTLSLYRGEKEIMSEMGEMLFTHFGISGPLVLSASAHMQKGNVSDYRIEIDLKPALDEQTLDARLVSDFNKYSAKDFVNSLSDLLPQKLIGEIIKRSKISPRKKTGEVTREERHKLLSVLKHFTLSPTAFRSLDEAVITCGGVNVKEISPSTMMSKKIKGLFFAGEIIDVDAYTGGYNLQIAWSTGRLAGVSAAQYAEEGKED